MSSQFVLTPSKHVRFDQSLLYIAGIVKQKLENKAKTIDVLYSLLEKEFREKDKIAPSFTEIVFAVDLLYALSQVELSNSGKVRLTKKGETE